ncbi:hypothetical protein NHJ13734_009900 [Beauveria thailandica]
MLFQTLLSITVASLVAAQRAPKTGILVTVWTEPNGGGEHQNIRNTGCQNLDSIVRDNVESVTNLKDGYHCSLYG